MALNGGTNTQRLDAYGIAEFRRRNNVRRLEYRRSPYLGLGITLLCFLGWVRIASGVRKGRLIIKPRTDYVTTSGALRDTAIHPPSGGSNAAGHDYPGSPPDRGGGWGAKARLRRDLGQGFITRPLFTEPHRRRSLGR